jgi:hypothetical protein
MIPPKPKPLQPSAAAPLKKNGSFNNRLRSSFRNKNQLVTWQSLWEASLEAKTGGGKLRNIDLKLQESTEKVKI